MKLVTTQPLDADEIAGFLPDAQVVFVDSDEALVREAADAEIIFGVGADTFGRILATSRTLRWAHTSTAGVDRYISDALRDGPVTLTCAKGGPAGGNLAEHALGLALALSRNIGESARSSHWRRRELSEGAFEISGRTAGIAGYGAAGRDLVRLLSGFRMRVLAVKRSRPFSESESVAVLGPDGFDRMCAESDVVFNFLPGTSETNKVFDRRAFEMMKRSALFVNVGRGSTVDTDALVDAVRDGEELLNVVDPDAGY